MSAAIDWSGLTPEKVRARGEPQFFETSTDVWKVRLKAWYEAETGRTVYPDQTEMFLIEMAAYAFSLLGEEAQMTAIQNLVAWASGSHLQALSENVAIEKQDGESDDRLAFRTFHAFDRVDRRGGWAGYGQFVFDVDVAITDVAVFRRSPCVIEIVALTGRVTATPELNGKIRTALHPETVRPQGDDIHLCTATGVVFDVVIWVRTTRPLAFIQPEIEAKATDAFNAFRRPSQPPESAVQFAPEIGLLSARVSPSPLHAAAIGVDGVIDVEVEGLTYSDLAWFEYPVLGSLTVKERSLDDA